STPWGPDLSPGTALVELRVLDGPNLYFPRPAVKVSLDLSALAGLPADRARAVAAALSIPTTTPGEPGSGHRQVLLERGTARLARAVARESGTTRLAVRARP